MNEITTPHIPLKALYEKQRAIWMCMTELLFHSLYDVWLPVYVVCVLFNVMQNERILQMESND